ncbi:MAG TPA: uroporphyrinogen-III synthase [Flavisolibacter sp.]|nr:uroporphyrinogen-III synthase [Flavisolibacter sp.]
MVKHKILSTKKLDPSLLEKAGNAGIEIIEQEFIAIRPIWSEEKFQEIIPTFKKSHVAFTSANAVVTVDRYLHPDNTFYVPDWRIFCLSGKTKQTVLKSPVLPKTIVGEAGHATDLAEEIIRQGVGEVVFFCGDKRRDELPKKLQEASIVVQEVVVYETIETASTVNGSFDAVLFFSPSAVQSFFSANQLHPSAVCFAVGYTTEHSILPFTNNKVITSIAPGQEEMINELINYFQNAESGQH